MTNRKALSILFSILFSMIIMQFVWHLIPRNLSEKEHCRLIVEKHHIENISLHNKTLFNIVDTTSYHAGAWVNKYKLLPSCRGLVKARFDLEKAASADETAIESIVENKKEQLDKELKLLRKEKDELDYFLKSHNVRDEGYDMVTTHYEVIKRNIESKQQLFDTLNVIKDLSNYCLNKFNTYTIVYRDYKNAIHKTNGKRVKTLADGTQLLQSKDKTKPKNMRPQHLYDTDLNFNLLAPTDTINRDIARLCRPGFGRKFLPKHVYGLTIDSLKRITLGQWEGNTLTEGVRKDSFGIYIGQLSNSAMANGHGVYIAKNGNYYEGHWTNDMRSGFGFSSGPLTNAHTGEWIDNIFKGERLNYTSDRIYGIDISRYQHDIGKKTYPIDWTNLRITQLGEISKKRISGRVDYPVSFVYIKSTEGTTILNKYYKSDYNAAKQHGKRVGAYHFFSTKSGAAAQANFFLKHTNIQKGDFPPVLDVEPTHKQIIDMGGVDVMLNRIRTWMRMVENATGCRPILYVGQSFVNRYLVDAPDIKKRYNIWIARYGEYKPDVHLIYWQLSPDGRVNGIHGDVDINVFNGYRAAFSEFLKTKLIP